MAKRGHFSRVPAAAVFDPRLTDREFRILAALGTYADRLGSCFPSIRTIAVRFGVSRQAIQNALRKPKAIGYLEVIGRARVSGSQQPNLYVLNYPSLDEAEGIATHSSEAVGGINRDEL